MRFGKCWTDSIGLVLGMVILIAPTGCSFKSEMRTFALKQVTDAEHLLPTFPGYHYSLAATRILLDTRLVVFEERMIVNRDNPDDDQSTPDPTVRYIPMLLPPESNSQNQILSLEFYDSPEFAFFLLLDSSFFVETSDGKLTFHDNTLRLKSVGVTYTDKTASAVSRYFQYGIDIAKAVADPGGFVKSPFSVPDTTDTKLQRERIKDVEVNISRAINLPEYFIAAAEGGKVDPKNAPMQRGEGQTGNRGTEWTRGEDSWVYTITNRIDLKKELILLKHRLDDHNLEQGKPISSDNQWSDVSATLKIQANVNPMPNDVLKVMNAAPERMGKLKSRGSVSLSKGTPYFPGILYCIPGEAQVQLLQNGQHVAKFSSSFPEFGRLGWIEITSEFLEKTERSLDFAENGRLLTHEIPTTNRSEDIQSIVDTLKDQLSQLETTIESDGER